VETYVKQHKHLPGSTPQADIEKKGGLSLDVETVNQQEKIEEACLHLIAFKKRMDLDCLGKRTGQPGGRTGYSSTFGKTTT
jgi:hypothetical protein